MTRFLKTEQNFPNFAPFSKTFYPSYTHPTLFHDTSNKSSMSSPQNGGTSWYALKGSRLIPSGGTHEDSILRQGHSPGASAHRTPHSLSRPHLVLRRLHPPTRHPRHHEHRPAHGALSDP